MVFKRKVTVALLTAAMVISFTGCDIKTDTPVVGRIAGLNENEVLKLCNNICTIDEAKLMIMNLQNQYKKDFGGEVSWNQKVGDTTLEKYILSKVKSDLSIVYAMSSIAADKEIELADEERKLIEDAASEYYEGLNEQEKNYSSATKESVAKLYENYYLADKVYDSTTDGISDNISDEEARVMKIQYIYIDTEKTSAKEAEETLKEVKKQVENGYQDFMVQANKYSNSKTIECNIKKNESTHEYKKKAFELSDGNLSEVIKESDGIYLVKCVNSYLEKETLENKEQIILDNKIKAFEKEYNSYIENGASDINSKVWENIEFSNDENVNADNLFDVYDKYLKTK